MVRSPRAASGGSRRGRRSFSLPAAAGSDPTVSGLWQQVVATPVGNLLASLLKHLCVRAYAAWLGR